MNGNESNQLTKFNLILSFLKEKYVQNNRILTKPILNDLKMKMNNFYTNTDNFTTVVLDILNLTDVLNAQIIVEDILSRQFNINLNNKTTLNDILSNNENVIDYCTNLINKLEKSVTICDNRNENSEIIVYEENGDKLVFIFYHNEENIKKVLLIANYKNEITRKNIDIPTVKSECPKNMECPFKSNYSQSNNTSNIWWPNQLDLRVLYPNNSLANPLDNNFNYTEAFNSLNLVDVKRDLSIVMTYSQKWWPADFGHYGPFIVRMAWHSAGTYRVGDGRGGGGNGLLRFAPLNSWNDNGNLDKARRLIWPVKQKYGNKISWADLMILAGNVALEIMGFKIKGFGGGRTDVWETDYYTYWGSETKMLDNNKRYSVNGQLEKPLAATNMGLIYVNPEGPNGNPDPILAAYDIRETFSRMGMNDEETVALIGGGHTIGKCHGAASESYVGPPPESAPISQMNFGWKNSFQTGKGPDTITSGLEVTWTDTPTKWSNTYFKYLFEFEWEPMKSPAGANQWVAINAEADIPDAFDPNIKHKPMMLTTDLSLRFDPIYNKISRKFLENIDLFAEAFANAWFKLTHRDMGPKTRYLGPEVPLYNYIWQDPIPTLNHKVISQNNINYLKNKIKDSGLSIYELVYTAWSSASTFRNTDKRGGANGSRISLLPMKFWKVNQYVQLQRVLLVLEKIKMDFNQQQLKTKVSLADLIVLGGNVGIEKAAERAGHLINVPFTPGRMDALQEETDITSFSYLEPKADGFRNYVLSNYAYESEKLLIDKASTLSLTGPEMTVIIGGLRAMGINFDKSKNGVLTNRPGMLTNDFFLNILDTNTVWEPTNTDENIYYGYNSETKKLLWSATRVDLIFGSNSQLRAICEVYASNDAHTKFISDFIKAWNKVMNLDRFDITYNPNNLPISQ